MPRTGLLPRTISTLFIIALLIHTTAAATTLSSSSSRATSSPASTSASKTTTTTIFSTSMSMATLSASTIVPSATEPTATYIANNDVLSRDDGEVIDQNDATLVYGLGYTMMVLNFLGTSYVIYRTFVRWRSANGRLSMALRLPFYIAMTDLVGVLLFALNQICPVIYGYVWPGMTCRVIGGLIFNVISMNMTAVGVIAVITYLRVCRGIPLGTGRYDWKLFTVMVMCPLVLTLISIENFGPGRFWCYTTTKDHLLPLIHALLNSSILATTLFCYISTLRQINRIDWIKFDETTRREMRVNTLVTRKIVAYVLIFILQWTPSMSYLLGEIFEYRPLWIYVVCNTTINIGGIGNCIQYGVNEGWKRHDNPHQPKPLASKSDNDEFDYRSTGGVTEYAAGFTLGEQAVHEYEFEMKRTDIGEGVQDSDLGYIKPVQAGRKTYRLSQGDNIA